MTYEELKAEADKLGYGLIKRTEYSTKFAISAIENLDTSLA